MNRSYLRMSHSISILIYSCIQLATASDWPNSQTATEEHREPTFSTNNTPKPNITIHSVEHRTAISKKEANPSYPRQHTKPIAHSPPLTPHAAHAHLPWTQHLYKRHATRKGGSLDSRDLRHCIPEPNPAPRAWRATSTPSAGASSS